ncbi:hypothetical protein [Arenimonas terrae]|uniref:Uncharacterized protein n=1 Tax=Arenimonas terrae TaxID=2546226 RepID=A0A5C4RTE3_9GAMM|nr:hypothetical protein [Arenimonas terrae]TNJ34224.1 hypothetical protein E1B00_00060 [Arenimonas terrae]
MRWPKWGLAGVVVLAGVAFWLLLAGPKEVFGVDPGGFGFGLLVLVAWAAVHGISAAPRTELDEAVSPGEWRAWIGVGFTLGVMAYLLAKADVIAGAGDLRDVGRIGRNIVLLLITWAVVGQVLQWRWKGKVLEDERDREIEVRAAGWARCALVFCVIGIAVTLGLTPAAHLAWATPIMLAHLLVFALVWHSLVEYAVTALSYWRDRRP